MALYTGSAPLGIGAEMLYTDSGGLVPKSCAVFEQSGAAAECCVCPEAVGCAPDSALRTGTGFAWALAVQSARERVTRTAKASTEVRSTQAHYISY